MNKGIKELADEAGFCFWEDEEWRPHGAIIDWSAQYDREFQRYTELLIKECIDIVEGGRFLHDESPPAIFAKECSSAIKRHFGIGE